MDNQEILKTNSTFDFDEDDKEVLKDAEEAEEFANRYSDDMYCGMSDDEIKTYLDQFRKFATLLTEEEIKKLCEQRDKGNQDEKKEAMKLLVCHNYRLVVSIVKKYCRTAQEFTDLMQIGFIGLTSAAEKYNPSVGKFSTYATRCIRNEIFKRQDGMRGFNIQDADRKKYYQVKKIKEQLQQENGCEPTYQELADAAGISLQEVNEILGIYSTPSSLDVTVNEDDETTVGDFVVDEEGLTPEQEFSRDEMTLGLRAMLSGTVEDIDWDIIDLSKERGMNNRETDTEIANELEFSTPEEVCERRIHVRKEVEKLLLNKAYELGFDKKRIYDFLQKI